MEPELAIVVALLRIVDQVKNFLDNKLLFCDGITAKIHIGIFLSRCVHQEEDEPETDVVLFARECFVKAFKSLSAQDWILARFRVGLLLDFTPENNALFFEIWRKWQSLPSKIDKENAPEDAREVINFFKKLFDALENILAPRLAEIQQL